MLRPLRHKKGQFEIIGKQLIEIILALIVLIAVVSYVVSVSNGLRVMKIKSARDIALTVETMQGTQGSVLFSFADAFGFQYEFTQNRVDVYRRDEETASRSITYFYFPQDNALKFLYPNQIIGPGGQERTVVSLKKSFPEFTFGQDDLSFASSSCEKIDVSAEPKMVLVMVSTADENIKGYANSILIPSLSGKGINAKYYDNSDQLIADAKANPGAVVIELASSGNENIRVYNTPDKKAISISCWMKNLLIKKSASFSPTVSTANSNSNPNLVNPISLRIEIMENSPYHEVMGIIAQALQEYFK